MLLSEPVCLCCWIMVNVSDVLMVIREPDVLMLDVKGTWSDLSSLSLFYCRWVTWFVVVS